ncbi:hypothetical protein E5K00_17400 [Hymenobacter aquaticus]|uniref:CbiN domain protein n=1 Tax=Hymenobacter aquaticus TaxID=1867101 RepID=A0A4Z0PXJ4_9BACT|nr:hypothetical protein [Hymenobacter aquaticus]TGE22029.1 hypothetical protein E5K00_17400 [Hymenobacter aquaticus]
MKTVLLAIVLICFAQQVEACSCGPVSRIKQKDLVNAELIFIGKLVRIDSLDLSDRRLVFEVISAIKTNGAKQLSVVTGYGNGDCGLDVELGQEWYIFAEPREGNARAMMCGRSFLMSQTTALVGSYTGYDDAAMEAYSAQIRRVALEIRYAKKHLPK